MNNRIEPRLERLLEEGESTLWSGRPNSDALCAGARRAPLLGSALRDYAGSLSYAVTNRRLLILEGDVITDQYFPGDLRQELVLVPRSDGFQDLVFEQVPYDVNSDRTEILWRRTPDPDRVRTGTTDAIRREQAQKAFKALDDAREVQALVATWQTERLANAREAAADFIDRTSSEDGSFQTVRNERLGFSIDLPADWLVKVRGKSSPLGKVAMDVINWESLGQAAEWNALLAEGKLDASVQVELVETPEPCATPRKLAGGLIFRLMGGKRVSLEESLSRGAYRGFAVTLLTPSRNREGSRMLQRCEVLHDGKKQFVLTTQWRQGAEELQRLTEAVAESVSLG